MSETKSTEPIEVKTLKENTSITVEIPSYLYYRLQELLMVGVAFKDVETAQKVLQTIHNSDKDPDAVTYHTRTLITLIGLLEDSAAKNDKLRTVKIDRNTGKVVQ